jgi:hypothetical protein
MAETELVQVDPGPGQMEQVAAALIRLADHPHDVVWRSRGGFFVVPEKVAVRYAAETAAAAEAEPAEKKTSPAKPRAARRRASAKTAAADTSKPAAPAKEPAKPRARASRSKKKGGDS